LQFSRSSSRGDKGFKLAAFSLLELSKCGCVVESSCGSGSGAKSFPTPGTFIFGVKDNGYELCWLHTAVVLLTLAPPSRLGRFFELFALAFVAWANGCARSWEMVARCSGFRCRQSCRKETV
jgi:hypothetical protein